MIFFIATRNKSIENKKLGSKDLLNLGPSIGGKILCSRSAGVKIGSSLKCLANKVLKLQTDKPLHQMKVTWMEKADDKTMIEQLLCFQINFNFKIFEVIHEAEMLEQLKFELPISMRDKSIQKDRLKVDIELTQTIIDQYNKLMDQLDPADVSYIYHFFDNFSLNKIFFQGTILFNF